MLNRSFWISPEFGSLRCSHIAISVTSMWQKMFFRCQTSRYALLMLASPHRKNIAAELGQTYVAKMLLEVPNINVNIADNEDLAQHARATHEAVERQYSVRVCVIANSNADIRS